MQPLVGPADAPLSHQPDPETKRPHAGFPDWCAESWRSDRVDALGWGAVFIWGGLVLLAETTGYASQFAWWDGWGVFLSGAGVVLLVEAVMRKLALRQERSVVGLVIFGGILIAIGMGEQLAWLWPLIMIGIGILIALRAFRRPTTL